MNIPTRLPEKVLRLADDYFYDTQTELFVAVKEIARGGITKTFMVAFTKSGGGYKLITIHPLKQNQKINRLNSKRWLKIDKKTI
ncbi:MAG: hypothetical protein HYT48_01905 [Candidatus Vogelbacteria bacterium]|nr:hypothetical protein [Candidatus Vogelbacteria bacterium]